jgi:hypothetical protein
MKNRLGVSLFAGAMASACGTSGPVPWERVVTTESAIQNGTADTTHKFAVGIVQTSQQQSGQVALCSGMLLAPNLVATARHCVANLSSAEITCATSTFGAVVATTDVLVTTDATIASKGNFVGVSSIIVPSGSSQTKVCGDDLALLILSDTISLPAYVTPVIDPPMTDHSTYGTTITAIGYGITSPSDTTGTTAGERRIKENVDLLCIPGDTTFTDCFSDPSASQVLSRAEFVSGDGSTCEGDSGSGAYDQGFFDKGEWVAFGVLSRGGVSSDGTTCIEPIYTRFDAWGSLITSAAVQAAAAGHYSLPVWAGGPDASAPDAATPVDDDASVATSSRDAATSAPKDAATSGVRDARAGNDAAPVAPHEDASSTTTVATDDGGTGGSSNETAASTMNQGCATATGGAPGTDAALLLGALGVIAGRARAKRCGSRGERRKLPA